MRTCLRKGFLGLTIKLGAELLSVSVKETTCIKVENAQRPSAGPLGDSILKSVRWCLQSSSEEDALKSQDSEPSTAR